MAQKNNSNRGNANKPTDGKNKSSASSTASKATPAASSAVDKKPQVTLDLKAKEVGIDDTKAKSASATGAAKAVDSSAKAAASEAKAAAGEATSAKASASSSGSSASKSGSGSSSAGSKSSKDPSGAAAAPKSGGGGGFMSHLAASLVGGIVALGGGWLLNGGGGQGPATGTDKPVAAAEFKATTQKLASLESKLAELAKAPKPDPAATTAATKEFDDKLQGIASRIKKVESLQGTVSQLAQAQQAVMTKSNELQQKLTDGTTDVEQVALLKRRLKSMEGMLTSLAQAAENQGAGTIPQLASLTGRINDINNSIDQKVGALRKSLSADMQAQNASMSARIETQLKANEEIETLKAGNQRIGIDVETLKETTGNLGTQITSVKKSIASLADADGAVKTALDDIKSSVAAAAKPADITSAIAPVSTQIASISKNVTGLLDREETRNKNASNIVLALELDNLKKSMNRGEDVSDDFDRIEKMAGGTVDLGPLKALKSKSVPTVTQLSKSFNTVAVEAIRAAAPTEEGGGIFGRLINNATSLVKLRRTDNLEGDGPDAVVARMEKALKSGDLTDVLKQSKSLPEPSKASFKPWLEGVTDRLTLNAAVEKVNNDLRNSVASSTAQ